MKLKRNELTAMVDNLGLPGLFNTYSYADTHWADTREILKNFTGKPLLRCTEVEQAIKDNPHVVTAFFVEKFKI